MPGPGRAVLVTKASTARDWNVPANVSVQEAERVLNADSVVSDVDVTR